MKSIFERDHETAVVERTAREASVRRHAESERLATETARELAEGVRLGLDWKEIRERLTRIRSK